MDVRNFVIIAHIDHGKSTLADRLLELTGTIEKRKMREQYLDMHPLEREKGITIKMQPVRMVWRDYILNLIDTPGHADFSYEVSRALACVEGAILLVDATKGIQAQTLSNFYLAREAELAIIPVVNKIDLPSANVEEATKELTLVTGAAPQDILKISAKEGRGVEELLQAVLEKIPPPRVFLEESYSKSAIQETPFRALVFDSKFDPYLGIVAYIRVFEGGIKAGEDIKFLATGAVGEAKEVGIFSPERISSSTLGAGEIGYVATGIKVPEKVKVGDTLVKLKSAEVKSLPGYRDPMPMVFASVYPENQDDYEILRESLNRLKLEDSSLNFNPEEAGIMGRGFRVGFLGMLHMEITAERLRRDYGISVVFTNPSVAFKVRLASGEEELIYSAAKMSMKNIQAIEEPWVEGDIIYPADYLGCISELLARHEGRIISTETLAGERIIFRFEAPLREIITNFYDELKSVSQGFASFFYELSGYRRADLTCLDILVAGEKVPQFSKIVPKKAAYREGRAFLEKLKAMLPQELFAVPLQAAAEGRIIARETIPALKKDVAGYLYGGDRTRKMKLWQKQKRGKKKLRERGRVEIPPEVFIRVMQK